MITPEEFQETARRILEEVSTAIVGQEAVTRGVLTALIGGGHVLLEGVPGLGKTSLVRAFGGALNLQFGRIQFTPDLMPADITGTSIVSEDEAGRRTLTFQKGAVFANLVLADEINRATPKTQSALLEAMQERTVTAGALTHALPEPFFVLATQNPIEMEGTYPLPEAQLDRFFFKLIVTYPFRGELAAIVRRTAGGDVAAVRAVAGAETLIAMNRLVREVPMSSHVLDYAVRLVLATQPDLAGSAEVSRKYIRIGASPRGAQAITLAGRIACLLDGRYNLSYEDVRSVVHPALRHRISLNFEAETRGMTADAILDEIVETVPEVPN
ncbi:MAG: ATPase associated with various cellular 3 [Chloroflexi bacterium]|jgi:MoxR-like ATPase|nr:ATPase associated with various cellular 3 [Chloroflexota bacterium]MDB5076031.1 ATPase associated with various cellular 3 [Chloroflexota bacterium]